MNLSDTISSLVELGVLSNRIETALRLRKVYTLKQLTLYFNETNSLSKLRSVGNNSIFQLIVALQQLIQDQLKKLPDDIELKSSFENRYLKEIISTSTCTKENLIDLWNSKYFLEKPNYKHSNVIKHLEIFLKIIFTESHSSFLSKKDGHTETNNLSNDVNLSLQTLNEQGKISNRALNQLPKVGLSTIYDILNYLKNNGKISNIPSTGINVEKEILLLIIPYLRKIEPPEQPIPLQFTKPSEKNYYAKHNINTIQDAIDTILLDKELPKYLTDRFGKNLIYKVIHYLLNINKKSEEEITITLPPPLSEISIEQISIFKIISKEDLSEIGKYNNFGEVVHNNRGYSTDLSYKIDKIIKVAKNNHIYLELISTIENSSTLAGLVPFNYVKRNFSNYHEFYVYLILRGNKKKIYQKHRLKTSSATQVYNWIEKANKIIHKYERLSSNELKETEYIEEVIIDLYNQGKLSTKILNFSREYNWTSIIDIYNDFLEGTNFRNIKSIGTKTINEIYRLIKPYIIKRLHTLSDHYLNLKDFDTKSVAFLSKNEIYSYHHLTIFLINNPTFNECRISSTSIETLICKVRSYLTKKEYKKSKLDNNLTTPYTTLEEIITDTLKSLKPKAKLVSETIMEIYKKDSYKNINEGSTALHISKERIRQLIQSNINNITLNLSTINNEYSREKEYINILDEQEIIYCTDEYISDLFPVLSKKYSNSLLGIVIHYTILKQKYQLLGNLSSLMYTPMQKPKKHFWWPYNVLIHPDLSSKVNFNNIAEDIEIRLNEKIESDYKLNIDGYLWQFVSEVESIPNIRMSVLNFISTIFGLQMTLEGDILIPRNTKKLNTEYVYEALQELDKISHINEIIGFLNNKYPNKVFNASSLKGALWANPDIVPIQRTSQFGLKEWRTTKESFYGGTYLDKVLHILSNYEYPLTYTELVEQINQFESETTIDKLRASLLASPQKNRLKFLKNSKIGLNPNYRNEL